MLLTEDNMAQLEEEDEDLIMRVLREIEIDFDEIPLQLASEEMAKEEKEVMVEVMKQEDIKEEVIGVEEKGFELSLTDGASAKVEIDYEKLLEDIQSKFESEDNVSAVAEFRFRGFSQQDLQQAAFLHDHNYLGYSKEWPNILGVLSFLLQVDLNGLDRRRNRWVDIWTY